MGRQIRPKFFLQVLTVWTLEVGKRKEKMEQNILKYLSYDEYFSTYLIQF